jgi:hypothetical protein
MGVATGLPKFRSLLLKNWIYFAQLPPQELLQSIDQLIAALAEQQFRPIVCPFLDKSTGTCIVYLY